MLKKHANHDKLQYRQNHKAFERFSSKPLLASIFAIWEILSIKGYSQFDQIYLDNILAD